MRVGLDVSVLRHGLSNGTAVYAFHLTEALLRTADGLDLVLYCGSRCSPAGRAALESLERDGARIVHGPAPWRWSPDAAWWLPVRPRTRGWLDGLDVFHAGELYFPPRPRVRCVATVHDLTAQLFPEYHGYMNRRLHERRLRWIARHASRVIVVSEATRHDLLRETGLDAARVDRVHEARGHDSSKREPREAVLARHGLDARPYVLMVGTIEPRKNHVRAIRAFGALAGRFADVRLVIAGRWGWHSGPIRRAIDTSPVHSRIHVLGEVPAADLATLYAGALVFAFPSLYEGFGLPLLEAMAAGAPVLTSCVSSMPEVAGGAALCVDPSSEDAIREGLERLLGDEALRRALVERGRRREAEFTWRRVAEETMDVYRRAMGEAPPSAGAPSST